MLPCTLGVKSFLGLNIGAGEASNSKLFVT